MSHEHGMDGIEIIYKKSRTFQNAKSKKKIGWKSDIIRRGGMDKNDLGPFVMPFTISLFLVYYYRE